MEKPRKGYLSLVGALYGKEQITPPRKTKVSAKRKHPEMDEQIRLCAWLDKRGILYYAIPNGGSRNKFEAFNLKRAGLKPGVPDLCIPIAAYQYHALYIELKSEKGVISDAQRYWIDRLNSIGNLAKVCYGAEEAKQVICDYLNIDQ